MLYTPDMDGLGNIRQVMTLCQELMASLPELSILILSGTPIMHSFRILDGVDYIKLPSLMEAECHGSGSGFPAKNTHHILKLRSDIILCAVANFKPDVVLVDNKPFGVQNEIKSTLAYLYEYLPQTKITLLLREFLDSSERNGEVGARQDYGAAIKKYYDEIFVLGSPDVFDPPEEYAYTPTMKALPRFRSYLRREPGLRSRAQVRQELGISQQEALVLVTAGSGEDGMHIFVNYLQGYARTPAAQRPHTLIIFGPEMVPEARLRLEEWARKFPRIHTRAFTEDLMSYSYMDAADVVVAMGGYGTVGEILTLNKPAIVIPRLEPVQEEWILAQRMEQLGVFQVMQPECLTPRKLMQSVHAQLADGFKRAKLVPTLDFQGLPWMNSTFQTLRNGCVPELSPPIMSENIMKA